MIRRLVDRLTRWTRLLTASGSATTRSRPEGVNMSIQDVVSKSKIASMGSWTRAVALVGIVMAVAGPFLLLTIGGREASKLPWYIWVIVPLLLLTVIAAGFARFNRVSTEAADISIRPKSR
jgi:hypothetical protein